MGESRTSAIEKGIRAGVWSGKGELHGEKSQVPRRKASLGEIEGSMSGSVDAKALQNDLQISLQVWPNLKWERRLGDKELTYKMRK